MFHAATESYRLISYYFPVFRDILEKKNKGPFKKYVRLEGGRGSLKKQKSKQKIGVGGGVVVVNQEQTFVFSFFEFLDMLLLYEHYCFRNTPIQLFQ